MTAGPQPFYVGDPVTYHHGLLDRTLTGKITNVTKQRIQLTLDDPPDHVQRVRSFTWAQAANVLSYRFDRTGDES